MLRNIKPLIMSGQNINKETIAETGKTLWEKLLNFLYFDIWPIIRDFKFIFLGLFVLLIIFIIIIWARKHVPSRGRIIDVYDATGERIDKKKKKHDHEIHNLPEDFYKKR